MLRTATPESIERLRIAATGTDQELDRALTNLGVLPPLDLGAIRLCLQEPCSVIVAETNQDGHRLLSVRDRYGVLGWIHHDGRVVHLPRAVAV